MEPAGNIFIKYNSCVCVLFLEIYKEYNFRNGLLFARGHFVAKGMSYCKFGNILVAWQGHRGDQKSQQTKQNSSQSNIIKDGRPGH